MNYKQLYAMKRDAERRIQNHNPKITHDSGIYIYTRDVKKVYIGQSNDMLERSCSHLLGYDQRIDISLKKYGLFNEYNQGGWKLNILEKCDIDELDQTEKYYIAKYGNMPNVELYNITGGGQGQGKEDINQRKPTKTYKDGVKYGHDKLLKEIHERLEKGNIRLVVVNPNKIREKHLDKLLDILEFDNEINNAD